MLRLSLMLGLAAGPAAAGLPWQPLSPATAGRLQAAASALEETPVGRRLLAETDGLARRESDAAAGGEALRYVREPQPALVVSPSRLKPLSADELQLALARELARASADLPVDLPEGDMAACQAELDFAMERSAEDQDFSRRLHEAHQAVSGTLEAVRSEAQHVAALLPPGQGLPAPLPPLPKSESERAGYLLALFARSTDEFYWGVEQLWPRPAGAVRLSELEDFVDRFGPDYGEAALGPGGRYAHVAGRRYPPALFLAAKSLAESGGMARIQEALGPFETVSADALRVKVNAWLRGAP